MSKAKVRTQCLPSLGVVAPLAMKWDTRDPVASSLPWRCGRSPGPLLTVRPLPQEVFYGKRPKEHVSPPF